MILELLDVQENTNKKTGEVKRKAIALGTFASYGNLQPATVEISLTADEFSILSKKKGNKVDLDLVIPLPTFPLTLNSLDNK